MMPWLYEFEWTPSHLVFLSIFAAVAVVVAGTVAVAALRAWQATRPPRVAHGSQDQVSVRPSDPARTSS